MKKRGAGSRGFGVLYLSSRVLFVTFLLVLVPFVVCLPYSYKCRKEKKLLATWHTTALTTFNRRLLAIMGVIAQDFLPKKLSRDFWDLSFPGDAELPLLIIPPEELLLARFEDVPTG